MKKVLAIFSVVIMMVCMSFNAFAKKGEFVESPSKNKAPIVVESTVEDKDCSADLIITSFADRAELSDKESKMLETAYDEIADSEDFTDLCDGLEDIAKKQNISAGNLAVSELFNISYDNCDDHKKHGYFDITIKAETFKNFVALMYRTDDGWKLVKDAVVKGVDGEYHLIFKITEFGPFAVVVNAESGLGESPVTGDNSNPYLYVGILVVSAAVAVVMLRKREEQVA